MALAAGARRTDSAYSRFLRAQNAYDVAIVNYPEDGTAVFDFDEIAALPTVADSARAAFEYYTFSAGNVVSEDGRIGTEINRFKILEGRRADPQAADEIVVGFALAEEHGLEVGDTVPLIPPEYIDFVRAPDTAPNPFADDVSAQQLEAELAAGRRLLAEIPEGTVRIVGIEASPGEFPPQFAVNRPLVHLTPAAHRLLDDGEHEGLMVRLHGGAEAVDGFITELERRSGGRPLGVIVQREHAAEVERSIHLQAVALWLLAGLTALATVLVVGQLLARLTHIESADGSTLRALGMSRRDRIELGVLRAAVIGTVGAAIGAAGACAASGAFPTGLARTAEPSPGADVDLPVLAIGVVATVSVIAALSLWPAWRAAVTGAPSAAGPPLASRLPGWLAAPAIPAPATVGVRMAVEPGRGTTAVPVRTTLAGVALGTAALTAAFTFGASLTHLLATPPLYGVTWDLEVTFGDGSGIGTSGVEFLRADDRVLGLAVGTASFGEMIELGDTQVDALVFGAVKGDIAPPVLQGRAPAAADEIAVGPQTLAALGADIGDRVEMRVPGARGVALMRIVGSAVFPTVGENTRLGRGALVTPGGAIEFVEGIAAEGNEITGAGQEDQDGGAELNANSAEPVPERQAAFGVLLQLAPGADGDELVAELAEHLGVDYDDMFPNQRFAPTDIVNFGRVETTPVVLGGVLAAFAAGALAHLLLSAVQRRRRDFAILKTLGFVRRQVAGAVAAQATTVTAIGLVVGVPVGVAVGRWVWTLMADSLGVVPRPQVPLSSLAAIVAASLVVANLIALVPGQLAARTRPANVLRSE
jgi:ABC-type lipoprotein release transport system permease subunit